MVRISICLILRTISYALAFKLEKEQIEGNARTLTMGYQVLKFLDNSSLKKRRYLLTQNQAVVVK